MKVFITNTRRIVYVLTNFFQLCTRAIGNLALKRLWIKFIEAKVFYLESERKAGADFFEKLCGNKDLTDFYDVVDSSPSKVAKNLETDKEISAVLHLKPFLAH